MNGRVARVLPDVAGLERPFDYLVPERWERDGRADLVRPGSLVRIDLHGRRVGGWVLDVDVAPPPGVTLRPLAKVTGLGPPPEVIELARWAAWRWAGRLSAFLRTASPPGAVRAIPEPAVPSRQVAAPGAAADAALGGRGSVVRLPPAADPFDVVSAAAARGNTLVLVPESVQAAALVRRLREAGVAAVAYPREWARAAAGATVVGTRAAAFAPMRDLAALVVLDEGDESHREQRAPTWHARDVALERGDRHHVPVVLTAVAPSLEALTARVLIRPSRAVERAGWPIVDVIDRRREGTPAGLLSERIVAVLRGPGPVVCVLNRTGRSRLLACDGCGELGRCDHCHGPVVQPDASTLTCPRCAATRPPVCPACGGTRFRNLRAGVSRVREELEALARRPVAEVTGAGSARSNPSGPPDAELYVGTEAVLHQVHRARAVIFLDFDQELLAPRARAAEQAFALLVRAARLVGGRQGGGRVMVQTRLPRHEVLEAALYADPGRLAAAEARRREELGLPPYRALAIVSGAGAGAYMERFGRPEGIEVRAGSDGRWLVSALDHTTLCDALAAARRAGERVRIEVDPLRH